MQVGDIVKWQRWASDRVTAGLVIEITEINNINAAFDDLDVNVMWFDTGDISTELASFLETIEVDEV